jgi:predicted polyphosphate/ATP-dependent NAD kinase
VVVATRTKLNSLIGKPLRVDTGDSEVDMMLTGYMRVTAGYREEVVKKVER